MSDDKIAFSHVTLTEADMDRFLAENPGEPFELTIDYAEQQLLAQADADLAGLPIPHDVDELVHHDMALAICHRLIARGWRKP